MRRKIGRLSAVALAVLSLVLVLGGQSASAAGTPQSSIPTALPAGFTPNIVDGTDSSGSSYRVFDMAQVGNLIVVGGVFAQVTDKSGTATGGKTFNRTNVFAFDKDTGAVSPFAPTINGVVNAVAAGPNGTVLVGGKFTTVNGVNTRNFAVLDLNGNKVSGVSPPVFNGAVQDIAISGNRVFVGGTFTQVGPTPAGGLVTLDATTWQLDPYVSMTVSGHHNYLVNKYKNSSGQLVWGAQAPVGVSALDISPDGSQMVIIGNFTSVQDQTTTYSRDQVAKILLPPTGNAAVDPNWATLRYHDPCRVQSFDSYIRSVQWSPDGSYWVITATGAAYQGTLCDSVARWNASDTGSTVQPAWVDSTGGDSLWSVAVTGTAVYVGGHERWLNNPFGSDAAKPGAVPRPGVAALDPLSGLPLSWNPGRNPRGIGAGALLATPDGLYVGMDTDYIGNFQYRRQKIAFFPLAGGAAAASQITGSLPGNVFLAGRATATQTAGIDAVVARSNYDPTTGAGSDATMTNNGGIVWSKSRGAFMAGNRLFYGYPDSTTSTNPTYEMAWQTFDGTTFGPQTMLTAPYHDPAWMNVQTGSGQTYDGAFPNFYGAELQSVTGMFYFNGGLYYTKTGSTALFYRGFSVDSGIVGAISTQVASTGFGNAGGFLLSNGTLYMADRTNGNLLSMSFNSGVPGTTQTIVSGPQQTDHRDWRTQSLFLLPTQTAPNQPPTAVIASATCNGQNCSFDATGSNDPDGNTPLTYTWDFGDGHSASVQTVTTTHNYAASGPVTVQLTVTDSRGGTGSTSTSLNVPPNPTTPAIAVRGQATGASTPTATASLSVPYPAGIQANDGLVLVISTNSATTPTSTPGFTLVGSQTAPATGTAVMNTQVLQRVADGTETGSLLIQYPTGSTLKATAQMVDYIGTPLSGPVRSVLGGNSCASTLTSCTTPTVKTGIVANDWAMSVWSDKSASGGTWTAPSTVTVRDNEVGTGSGGVMATLMADSGGPLSASSYGGLTATLNNAATRAIMLTVLIAGS